MKTIDKILAYITAWGLVLMLIGLSFYLGLRQGYDEGYMDALYEEAEYVCNVDV